MRVDEDAGDRVLRPRDAADVQALLQESREAIDVGGGGSKQRVGAPVPARTMTLAALRGIVDYEPAELVITAEAGTPLAEVEAALAAHGQRLAFEPPRFARLLWGDTGAPEPTLGGIVAANVSGSRRLAGGAARDHFLGFEAVSGDAVRFRAGGRVVKNVTGYDLPKLIAGSWGTLAVLTRVTLRVVPAAETERTLVLPVADPCQAVEVMTRALATPHDVSAAAFIPGRGAALRLEGFERSVRARVQRLQAAFAPAQTDLIEAEASRSWWRSVADVEPLAAAPVVVRISVPPSAAPRIIESLGPAHYLLDWAGGLIWAGFDTVDMQRLRAGLGEGHATLWKAPAELRRRGGVFPPLPPPLAAVAARLKTAFDPAGRLSPGRLASSEVGAD